KEEVNLDVHNIRYIASQAWPFSSSLMVGFTAETETTAFQVDGNEIEDAKWYSAKEIQEGVAKKTLELSKEDSIARYLIESWVKNN
ncbi:MAG TPA: NUDIX domain-containing protein, partial [Pricia sp.]|nr:NUDIX domain-containing protein [Pricia sp.]